MGQSSFSRLFLKGELLSGAWNTAVKVIGGVNSVITIAVLSVYQFGLYQLSLSVAAIVASFIPDMFDDVVFADIGRRLGAKEYPSAKRLFREFAGIKITLGAAASLVLFTLSYIAPQYVHTDIASYVRIISFLPLISALQSSILLFFNARISFSGLPVNAIREAAKLVFIGFFFIVVRRLGIAEILWATTGSQVVALVITGIFFLREHSATFKNTFEGPVPILFPLIRSYGGWAVLRYYTTQASKAARPWIIRIFLNTEAVGLFSVATTLYGMASSFMPLGTLGMLLPRETLDRDRLRHIFTRSMKYATALSALGVIGSILIVPILINLFFPKYNPAMPVWRVMALAILFYGGFKVIRMFLIALKEQRILFFRSLGTAILSPILLLIFTPLLGLEGAALEVVLIEAISLAIYYYYLRKSHPYLSLHAREFFSIDTYDREFLSRVFRIGKEFAGNKLRK